MMPVMGFGLAVAAKELQSAIAKSLILEIIFMY